MYKIKTLNSIPEIINEVLTGDLYAINPSETNPNAIIVRSYNMLSMEFGSDLYAIARAGAGVNTIPVDSCSQKGIVVFNTPGANANAVKEMTICALIMSARNILESISWTSSLTGDDIPQQAEKGKGKFVGNELKGKTLGIIGLGATGALVAQAALNLNMKVLGTDPHLSLNAAWNLNNNVKSASEDEIIRNSDFITVHVPLTNETREKYNDEFINKCKKGVVLLNFSRAEIANSDAIKKALDSGHLKKYVVDFPTKELLNYPGVISLPHLASGTNEAEDNCAVMAAEQIKEYLENGNIKNSINYPECNLGVCTKAGRICILHKNIPQLINHITTIISKNNINIAGMLNNSKGEYAYTIMDIDANIDNQAKNEILGIDGVLNIRIIK